MQIMSVSDAYQVRDMTKRLGLSVVKKAYDWSKANLDSDFDVSIRWTNSKRIEKGGTIVTQNFERIVSIIEATSDIERTEIDEPGTLVGLDVDKSRFNFFAADQHISGPLSDEFDRTKEYAVNHRYTAKIEVERATEYAAQIDRVSYKLVALIEH